MARAPIDVEVRGLRTPRERVWVAIRALKKGFTRLEVGDACDPPVRQSTVDGYMDDLIAAGYVVMVKPGKRNPQRGCAQEPNRYDLVNDQLEAPRVTRGGRISTKGMAALAMWRVIRMLRNGFDHHEVAKLASVDGFEVRPDTAKKYVYALSRAGYFAVVRAGTNRLTTRYRLIKDTGPHAPVLSATRGVFDRNTGAFAPVQTPQEMCDGIEA